MKDLIETTGHDFTVVNAISIALVFLISLPFFCQGRKNTPKSLFRIQRYQFSYRSCSSSA